MTIKELSSETSYVIDPLAARLKTSELADLLARYNNSPRRRHRYCFHQNPNVDLHDIIICYDNQSYIPPNKHIGKVESLLVLKGSLEVFFFNDSGIVYEVVRLSAIESGKPFYLRIPPNTWHGLRATSGEPCVIKETISGPYDRSSLKWAEFAPPETESSTNGLEWYHEVSKDAADLGIEPSTDEVFEQITDSVFRSCRQLVTVSRPQLERIVSAAKASSMQRARLCCHGSNYEALQEMFIVLARGVNIEESVHLRKDESLTVIEGSGEYLFPNEDGSEREVVSLGPNSSIDSHSDSTCNFFVRINRYVPHKIKVSSDFMIIHEATTGPFRKSDTDYRLKGV